MTVEQRLTRWALSGDTGTSSETLACAVLGIPDNNRRFGLKLHTDAMTGCQYLSTSGGGITPRLDSQGRQICNLEAK